MKISLITATYNSAATLKSTFKSVLSQTYTDIDYWVIDGDSTDGTIDIIKEYEAVFGGRMHYISEKDRGIYDAMNKGESAAAREMWWEYSIPTTISLPMMCCRTWRIPSAPMKPSMPYMATFIL